MTEYFKAEDLDRFAEVGRHSPTLFRKCMDWYNDALERGVLIKREKVQIGVAVAHANPVPVLHRRLF